MSSFHATWRCEIGIILRSILFPGPSFRTISGTISSEALGESLNICASSFPYCKMGLTAPTFQGCKGLEIVPVKCFSCLAQNRCSTNGIIIFLAATTTMTSLMIDYSSSFAGCALSQTPCFGHTSITWGLCHLDDSHRSILLYKLRAAPPFLCPVLARGVVVAVRGNRWLLCSLSRRGPETWRWASGNSSGASGLALPQAKWSI